jgi:hypothetical protein
MFVIFVSLLEENNNLLLLAKRANLVRFCVRRTGKRRWGANVRYT